MKGDGGKIIRQCRDEVGMTQADLSKASGVARVTIATYEAGNSEPSFERFQSLLDVMGYEVTVRRKAPREIRRMIGKEIMRK